MVRWLRWHCPPDTGFEIRALAVWGWARYLSVTEAPHNTDCVGSNCRKLFERNLCDPSRRSVRPGHTLVHWFECPSFSVSLFLNDINGWYVLGVYFHREQSTPYPTRARMLVQATIHWGFGLVEMDGPGLLPLARQDITIFLPHCMICHDSSPPALNLHSTYSYKYTPNTS